jgi:pyruvate dehydrogenase E2 component (dihydrolipoamide acetyltransferase)
MATPIEMPKLGNTVEECLISRWRKQVGETVAADEIIADIETDKSTFELTTPVAGTLLGVFFGDGDLVPVYSNVCVVGTPGEAIDAFRPKAPSHASPPPQQAQVVQAAAPGRNTPTAAPASGASSAVMSPRARRFAEEHSFFPDGIVGSGPGGRVLEEDLKQLYHRAPRPSSLAGKMMEDGYEFRGGVSAAAGLVLSGDLTAPPLTLSTIRDRIARRMRHSLASTAQYTMNASAVASGLLSLRARIKAGPATGETASININDMVMFSVVKALLAVPEVNVELVDGKIYQHSSVHIGFACDTPKGLLVPVVRDSQALALPELAARIRALTEQALEGAIAPDDLTGATFTVSNLGTFGVESFTPILNPPQVAILGVNTIELKPVRRNGTVEFVEHIGLSLTCDHQVIDGAPGSRFLRTVRELIENIESIAGLDL